MKWFPNIVGTSNYSTTQNGRFQEKQLHLTCNLIKVAIGKTCDNREELTSSVNWIYRQVYAAAIPGKPIL
jgi:hypothetical protein